MLSCKYWIYLCMSQVTLNSSVNFVIYCRFGDEFKRFISLKLKPTFVLLYFLQIFSFYLSFTFFSSTESSPTLFSQCWVSDLSFLTKSILMEILCYSHLPQKKYLNTLTLLFSLLLNSNIEENY